MKPIRMKCIAAERCTDKTCTHSAEHDYNEGCNWFCHHSDYKPLCQPVSKGMQFAIDKIRLDWRTWLGIKESIR
jgi:hypothetical protein